MKDKSVLHAPNKGVYVPSTVFARIIMFQREVSEMSRNILAKICDITYIVQNVHMENLKRLQAV